MNERLDKFLDNAAEPGLLISGHDLRALWSGGPHENDPEHPEDKDWASSEPDPHAPERRSILSTQVGSSARRLVGITQYPWDSSGNITLNAQLGRDSE
ncbi:MAG TPA: hypothetical protein VIJ18_18515 [Microbacteriaceae bacterium]